MLTPTRTTFRQMLPAVEPRWTVRAYAPGTSATFVSDRSHPNAEPESQRRLHQHEIREQARPVRAGDIDHRVAEARSVVFVVRLGQQLPWQVERVRRQDWV